MNDRIHAGDGRLQAFGSGEITLYSVPTSLSRILCVRWTTNQNPQLVAFFGKMASDTRTDLSCGTCKKKLHRCQSTTMKACCESFRSRAAHHSADGPVRKGKKKASA